MGQNYPDNWRNSPAGKAAKPGFEGKDTRIFSGEGAPGISIAHGGKVEGLNPVKGKKAPILK